MSSAVLMEPRVTCGTTSPYGYVYSASGSWSGDEYIQLALASAMLAYSAPTVHAEKNGTQGQVSAYINSSLTNFDVLGERASTRMLTTEEHEIFREAILECAEIVSGGRFVEL